MSFKTPTGKCNYIVGFKRNKEIEKKYGRKQGTGFY
jgi:hypothetical protein